MKKYLLLSLLMLCLAACGGKYKYETVQGDPLKTRIYTLDNGLKVYMNVDHATPRLQTYIAVRTGSKNDPAQTTGLAHYFEHLMFKGTSNFGTSDYAVEKPMLDQIEALFETYRQTTDEAERAALYRQIDSISYEASKYAIPNEYDKLMSTIGAEGTNAFTSTDMTVFVEDIPANQIENWLRIEADRFKNPVIRGFHTELETIYEEKNMSLTNDDNKVREALDAALFPNHPYGRQTVLGTQESLKNPSITNVRNFHKTYYVPNNMAITLSGDFNPDEVIALVDKYFGDMQPNHDLPALQFEPEQPVTAPIVRDVYGLNAENVALAWRTDGAASDDALIAEVVAKILKNGMAGLIDTDIDQQQKALSTTSMAMIQPDYGKLVLSGYPKAGQSLEELRDLLLAEVDKLRKGEFDESLLEGTINNYKVMTMMQFDNNEDRAGLMLMSFINDTPWSETVHKIDALSKITKDQIVAWANEKLGPESYAVVYKRQGDDNSIQKISKPQITPIVMNRDQTSAFVAEVQASPVKPIEPVFVDFKKDMSTFAPHQGVEVLYKKNETNGLFSLTYLFETGTNDNPALGVAFDYLNYLGTPTRPAEQIYKEFYDLGCNFSFATEGNRCSVTVSGLSENMDKAMELVEDLWANAQPNEEVLNNLKADRFQLRTNAKLNQDSNFTALRRLLYYGPEYIRTITLTDTDLATLTSDKLLGDVRSLAGKEHRILYYGPQSEQELQKSLKAHHKTVEAPEKLTSTHPQIQLTPENKVFVAPYDAKQVYYIQLSNRGEKFDLKNDPEVTLFNEYFGSGPNAVVFQEMREARSLAYTAAAALVSPSYADTDYNFMAFIATQNDKMKQAAEAFAEIIENMPESETAFNIAKEALLARMRTSRIVKDEVLWSYVGAQDMGLDADRDRQVFERVQSMTLADVKAAHQKWVEGRKYSFGILGDPREIDMNYLSTLGPVQVVSQQEMFGY